MLTIPELAIMASMSTVTRTPAPSKALVAEVAYSSNLDKLVPTLARDQGKMRQVESSVRRPADDEVRKSHGAYYTPDEVVRTLVCWAVRRPTDRMLDPACGDGRFLLAHSTNSVGVEQDPLASALVHQRSPGSLIHEGDFFTWAAETSVRFDCAAGNPPFIRYQRFNGPVREAALRLCARHGALFSSLCSSWAPFLVATATLLRKGGRMAFVVPAEIGHAPYSKPVVEFFAKHFSHVQIVAVRRKLFPELSEDCWLLYADGYGESTNHVYFSPFVQFAYMPAPPKVRVRVGLGEWKAWNHRFRPFFLTPEARELYRAISDDAAAVKLGRVARVGIGYVTGANDFFHLRPSVADRWGIPPTFLHPAVRNGKALEGRSITPSMVKRWCASDDPVLLLRIGRSDSLPRAIRRYLDSPDGLAARSTYKCRNRDPWYVVPDVTVPDAFLSYMSGEGPTLVRNTAGCVGTNSVHVVRMKGAARLSALQAAWSEPLTALSSELEGHPLGGGMLKVEPGEATRILVGERRSFSKTERACIRESIDTMRRWRHYG